MASGYKSTIIYAPASAVYGYTLEAYFNETSTSISGNYSTIYCSATLSSNVISYSNTEGGILAIYWHDNNTNQDTWVASDYINQCGMSYGTKTISGNINATHNADGTLSGYAYAYFVKNKANVYIPATSGIATDWVALTNIPRQANINTAPDFNDEQNPTITYTNSAGDSVTTLQACISLTGASDDIAYRDIPKTGNSYTFNLTNAERNVLRNATTTSKTRNVTFYVKTIIGGVTYYSTLTRTLTIINANPTFIASQLTYKDTKASVVAITGNNQNIVRNNSTLQYIFTAASGLKGASISSYEINFNGVTTTRSTAGTINYGIVNASSDLTLSIKAIDTRGNSTTISKTITILDWVLPSATISIARINNYEDTTKIKVVGSISSVDSKNAIQGIRYRSKKTEDASYSAWTTISNNVEYTKTFDKTYSWDIQIEITDKFGTTTYNLVLAKGMPILFIDIEKLSVGVNCFPALDNSLELNGEPVGGGGSGDRVPIGSIMPFTSSTIPTNWLLCDGSAVSRTTYADLFAVIGTTYGSGDGSTTFNLPNLQSRIPVGKSSDAEFNTLGKTGGEKTHTLTINEMPSHTHNMSIYLQRYGNGSALAHGSYYGNNMGGSIVNNYEGGSQPHNNLQPYQVVNYIIKVAKDNDAPVTSQVTNTYTESSSDVYSCDYVNGIISSGSNSNGNWIKFLDGTMICSKRYDANFSFTNQYGSVYYAGSYEWTYPQRFLNYTSVSVQTNIACLSEIMSSSLNWSNETTCSYFLYSFLNKPNKDCTISLMAVGRWK